MIPYEQHQRDYTVLGTDVIMHEYQNADFKNFFDYQSKDMFILIKEGIFYHFTASDENKRGEWMYSHSLEELNKIKNETDALVKEYHIFLKENPKDTVLAIKKVHEYFRKFLIPGLLALHVPEKTTGLAHDISMEMRKSYDNVYKLGMSFEAGLLNKLEEEKGMKKDSLSYLTEEEFNVFCETGELPELLLQREEYMFARVNKKSVVYYEKGMEKKLGLVVDIADNLTEIKGQIAFKGKAKGKVRIIRKISDAKDFEEGEILVTSMTDPRYLSTMKKASAIVTDEGGITCHAAIVARELGIPCIIGTKIATKVFKDGDLVEVDANTGVVKKV